MSKTVQIGNSTYMKPKPELDAELEMLKGYNPMYDSRLQVNGTILNYGNYNTSDHVYPQTIGYGATTAEEYQNIIGLTTCTDNVILNSVQHGAWNDNKITYESIKGQLLKDVKKADEEDISSDSIVKKLKKKVMTFELMEL